MPEWRAASGAGCKRWRSSTRPPTSSRSSCSPAPRRTRPADPCRAGGGTASRRLLPAASLHGAPVDGQALVAVVERLHRLGELLEVGGALRLAARGPGVEDRRQEETGQNPDDRDDNQDLDERQAVATRLHGSPLSLQAGESLAQPYLHEMYRPAGTQGIGQPDRWGRALPGELVHNRQHPERPAAGHVAGRSHHRCRPPPHPPHNCRQRCRVPIE